MTVVVVVVAIGPEGKGCHGGMNARIEARSHAGPEQRILTREVGEPRQARVDDIAVNVKELRNGLATPRGWRRSL